jgi:hypothetical protein
MKNDKEFWECYDKLGDDMMGTFAFMRLPNASDICMMWNKKEHPYNSEKDLPNYHQTKTCFNCKYSDKMSCGSHIEWSCGLTYEFVNDYDCVCDLHEWD